MEDVGAGAEHGGEALAGGAGDLAQEALLLRRAAGPVVAHRDHPLVGQLERADVERIAEGVLGNLGVGLAILVAAGIGRHLPDLDHRLAEPAHRRGLDAFDDPGLQLRDDRAGQGRLRLHRNEAVGEGRDLERLGHAAGPCPVDLRDRPNMVARLDQPFGQAGDFGFRAPGLALLEHTQPAAGNDAGDGDRRHDAGNDSRHGAENADDSVDESSTTTEWPRWRSHSNVTRSENGVDSLLAGQGQQLQRRSAGPLLAALPLADQR